MTDLIVQDNAHPPAPQQTLFDLAPRQMVNSAAAMATVLADVIEKQKLYTPIQGKKYVRAEGWATLGSMLGILPRERPGSVVELPDGSYEAYVELYSVRDGRVVGGSSAICGMEEKRWANSDRYARRSMAITRATGKAYRLGFAWVMALAGFEGTPAEEMDFTPTRAHSRPAPENFSKTNSAHLERLGKFLTAQGVKEEDYDKVANELDGKPIDKKTIDEILSRMG